MTSSLPTKERSENMPVATPGTPARVDSGGKLALSATLSRGRDYVSGLAKECSTGLKLALALLITGCWPGADYLNQVTITLHVVTYGYFCYAAWKLNRLLKNKDDSYPVGPREGVFFMIVPFFYIFWNFHWVSTAAEAVRPDHGRVSALILGAVAAGASVLCFPDMIGRFPPVLSIAGFIALFSILNLLLNKIR